MSGPLPGNTHDVRVIDHADQGAELALEEVRLVLGRESRPLICFATGGTFHRTLARLQQEIEGGSVATAAFVATHLDEYLGFAPDRQGSMMQELGEHCPALMDMLRGGSFLPVPGDGSTAALEAHAARLQRAGGVKLQFLGIGRNGHIAFNEPGTPFDSRFHVTTLAASTREDARARFGAGDPPLRAVSAGLLDIMSAERCVLMALGKAKAEAVRAMLEGEVEPACPASALRGHGNLLVVLDRAAASRLQGR